MGAVYHWVTKINPSLVAATVIGSAAFVAAAGIIGDAIKAGKTEISLSVQIDNKGQVKAYRLKDGKLEPVK